MNGYVPVISDMRCLVLILLLALPLCAGLASAQLVGGTVTGGGYGDLDMVAPLPDPAEWATNGEPGSTGSQSIEMTAETALDSSGVEYYFACTNAGCNDSDWQDAAYYEDTNLIENTLYRYSVMYRDKSHRQNQGSASTIEEATTDAGTGAEAWYKDSFNRADHLTDLNANCGVGDTCEWVEYVADSKAMEIIANTVAVQDTAEWRIVTDADAESSQLAQYVAAQYAGTVDSRFSGPCLRDTGGNTVSDSFYCFRFNKEDAEYVIRACHYSATCETIATIVAANLGDGLQFASGDSLAFAVEGLGDSTEFTFWKWEGMAPPAHDTWGVEDWSVCASTCDQSWDSASTAPTQTTAGAADTGLRGGIYAGAASIARWDNWVFGPSAADTDAPTPEPMTFAVAPAAVSDQSIDMTASTASDPNGVEYYFACTVGVACSDSVWQDSTYYLDTGLAASTSYTYTVQARDKSAGQNANTASGGSLATTDATDSTAPTPEPMTFANVPAATGTTSADMTANTASDPSDVEYNFACTSGACTSSGWQDPTYYEDTTLTEGGSYEYTVQARDKSTNQNANTASSAESVSTLTDTGKPTCATCSVSTTSEFSVAPNATASTAFNMQAALTVDALSPPVLYKFDNTDGPFTRDWDESRSHTVNNAVAETTYTFTVQAKDQAATPNLTTVSASAQVTTPAASSTSYPSSVLAGRDGGVVGITDAECPNWEATKETISSGTVTLDTAGERDYSYKHITNGELRVEIDNVRIKCVVAEAGRYSLKCYGRDGCVDMVVEDSEFTGGTSSSLYINNAGGANVRATLRRNFFGGRSPNDGNADVLKLEGGPIWFEGNVVGGTMDKWGTSSCSQHNDTAQMRDAVTDSVFLNNRFTTIMSNVNGCAPDPYEAAKVGDGGIFMEINGYNRVLFQGNIIGWAKYAFNVPCTTSCNNATIRDNVFIDDSFGSGTWRWNTVQSNCAAISDNTWETSGLSVSVPAGNDASCILPSIWPGGM